MAAEAESLMTKEPLTAESSGSNNNNDKPAAGSGKPAMVLGIDESEHSYYALDWTIHHFFPPGTHPQPQQQYRLVVVSAKPPAASVIGIAGIGTAELLPTVELDLKRASARVIDRAKDHCSHVADVTYEVKEGDARNVLCEAVDRHHADMLVMGSHGYGAFKRAVLGSVSDYCSHHADCTVMIVKRPKHHKKPEHWRPFHKKEA
ncbi:universal stress protein PHOS34 [Brachypodium distachyon]|nr:universal stress protein PHOS34 [Brachypodium distachyon]|eukprot:XP_003575585.1 universal stress protein PHOS34 [Brachypodium distachyon]